MFCFSDGQRAVPDPFPIDHFFFGDPQAIRHFDDIYPVDEGFVTPVVTERLPLRLIRVNSYKMCHAGDFLKNRRA